MLSRSNLTLTNQPIPVTVTLLNDGVNGEQPETITLTLVQHSTSEPNQILAHDTVRITLDERMCTNN